MATTNLNLGRYWEDFIRQEVTSGRYASASEVVCDALRTLEEHRGRMDTLRAHLGEGAAQSSRGDYVDSFDVDQVIAEIDGAG